VKFNDPKINRIEMNEMLQDLWSSFTHKTHTVTHTFRHENLH
jgi:hypothetical protein